MSYVNYSQEFMVALESADISKICRVPKADLHNHGFLGTRRSNIEKWANVSILPPPEYFSTLDDMSAYINKSIVPYLFSKSGIEFAFRSAIEDAIDDGVSLLEMSVDARIISLYPAGVEEMISFIDNMHKEVAQNIIFRPELGISRDYSLDDVKAVVEECIASGVFHSIDLYGNESAQAPENYKSVYTLAKRSGMKLKAHVGEFGSSESIWHTLEILDLDEIQHGINAIHSPKLMQSLAQHSIRLNICPTSNRILSRVPSMKVHPIRILYDNGVPVSINTDDLTIFNQSVSEEYLNLFRAGVFTASELDDIRRSSLKTKDSIIK